MTSQISRRILAKSAIALAAVASAFGAVSASAQAFPTKPIVLVVPFAAGGPTDVVARTLAASMTKILNSAVVVENTPGAGGTLAAQRVARSAPDGYTYLIHHNGMATAVGLYRKLNYDPMKDFEYVGQVADVPMTLIARKTLPPNTMPELISYLKANKDKVTLANAGLGAVSHLCGMLFQQAIGVDLTTVPYKGTAPAMTDLIGGQVDVMCDQTTQTIPQIKGQTVKLFGVTSTSAIPQLPGVKPLAEQGMPGFDVTVWHGVYGAKGTPKEALDKVNTTMREALKDPGLVQKMNELGAVIVPASKQTPEGLRTWLDAEIKKWVPIIKKAGQYAD